MCGICGNGSTVSVLRFKCYDDCIADDYVFYYATAILGNGDEEMILLFIFVSYFSFQLSLIPF